MLKKLNNDTNNDTYVATNSGRKNRNYLVVKGKPTRLFYQMIKMEDKFKKLVNHY